MKIFFSKDEKKSKPFNKRDLEKGFKNLNSKSSPDQCGISNKILKNLSDLTKDFLLTLFNE